MNILAQLRARFEPTLQSLTDDPSPYVAMVKPTQDARFGDFQANCAMPLAKQTGKNPRELAAQIVAQLELADFCDAPEVAGPGFINIRLRDDWLAQQTKGLIVDDRLGHPQVTAPRHFIVDYSAPNVAKPMHVGHLRSSVIGDALCRILRFLGHQVTGDNHIGDWGTQFGMILFGYKNFLDPKAYADEPVIELARLYRLVSQLSGYHELVTQLPQLQQQLTDAQTRLETANVAAQAVTQTGGKPDKRALKKLRSEIEDVRKKTAAGKQRIAEVENHPELKALADAHPTIAEAARAETAKLHAGDTENSQLWERFIPQCLKALDAMYERLGITFDLALGESYYQPMLAKLVEELEASGVLRESEGAMCAFVEDLDAPFIVRKQDGAFTYATTDLATIKYRCAELAADTILYVVDARQSGHFRLLFPTARRWGFDGVEFQHVSFGTVLGQDGRPYKTRSGDTVGLESLLDKAIERARRIVDENDDSKPEGPELDETTRAEVAEVVGIGGIKYADLHHNRDSDYVFNWDKMLATNGDTATYLQYACARISGIFRKGGIERESLRQSGGPIQFTDPAERALALQLNRFADTLDAVVTEYRPNLLTQYLFDTANRFSTFYNECHVLRETDEQVRSSRLQLCDLTGRILALGLSLLGIRTCEQM